MSNVLKLTYRNINFKNFPGDIHSDLASRAKEEGRKGEGREGMKGREGIGEGEEADEE